MDGNDYCGPTTAELVAWIQRKLGSGGPSEVFYGPVAGGGLLVRTEGGPHQHAQLTAEVAQKRNALKSPDPLQLGWC